MKTLIAIVVALIVVFAAYSIFTRPAAAPVSLPIDTAALAETAPTDSQAAPSTENTSSVTLVTYTDNGFSPKTVTIKTGEVLRFVNQSSRPMWVASAFHPTHEKYDGTTTSEHCSGGVDTTGTLDECRGAAVGESWDFTFTKEGMWGYHNHLSASDTGSVTVTN